MITGSLDSAFVTLVDYLSFHVLLCLIPAFFIAGAMTIFIPEDIVMKYIGPDAKSYIAYPSAAMGGLLLAVCSCTVLPLFVSIYRKGAGLGPAMTFLFSAPAVNILALTYTGTLIGIDIAIARAVLAISFAIVIGVLMDVIFSDKSKNPVNPPNMSQKAIDSSGEGFYSTDQRKNRLESILVSLVIISGILLILLEIQPLLIVLYMIGFLILCLLTYFSSRESLVLFSWLIYTLFVGTSRISPIKKELPLWGVKIDPEITNMLFKLLLVGILSVFILLYSLLVLDKEDRADWMQETRFFFKSIFPYIIAGVFIAGAIKFFVPEDLVVELVGQNTVLANIFAVFFGIFMYFPTLMEVPIARTFLDLGMARGPLLAYLLADPELSIQSILVTRRFIGDKKNLVYVLLVAVLTTIAGLLFGFFIGEGISFF